MNRLRIEDASFVPDSAWQPLPGGELEGMPPKAICPKCRSAAREHVEPPLSSLALCFQCYLLDIERNRRLKAAGDFHTASEARFQSSLPFEPVNYARLIQLKTERQAARVAERKGPGLYIEKRRRAQIEARHALATILQGLKQRRFVSDGDRAGSPPLRTSTMCGADVQLPASWLPFVVAQ